MLSSLLSPNNTKRCQDNNNKNGMGNDTCGLLADCPKAKKSRTIEFDDDYTSNWAYLPSVVLYEIFKLLSHKDRINASSTCRHWRNNFYHPRFCQNATIKITPSNLSDNIYKDSAVIDNIRSATLKFDSLSSSCVSDLINILQQLVVSNNLKSLLIEPSHCQIVQPYKCFDAPNDEKRSLVSQLILECCSLPLTHFSIGGSEDLCHFVPQFLRKLATTKPNAVTLLGLASVKEEPSEYIITETSPTLFKPFKNIEVLSIDYDILCDDLIEALQDKAKLSRLIIHVHGVCNDHPGTSEEAWMNFQSAHPNCEVRVSFIHAYDEVSQMHTNILRRNMPLSHLKVYFCEQINIDLLNLIPNWYFRTLRSIVWIDSQYRDSQSTTDSLIKLQETEPDPLVMAAWACRGLEEVVLLGYQYYEESLIAIARLRCNSLRILEVASENTFSMFQGSDKAPINLKIEIGDIMRKPWAPLKKTEMHPVLYSSVAGDSDEYLLPKILADLN